MNIRSSLDLRCQIGFKQIVRAKYGYQSYSHAVIGVGNCRGCGWRVDWERVKVPLAKQLDIPESRVGQL